MFNPIRLDANNPSPMTGSGNHTYLLIGADGSAVLIDAGVGDSRHLEALSQALDTGHTRLRDVIVTHGHPDHASGAPAIAREHRDARFFKYPWPEQDSKYRIDWQPIAEGQTFAAGGSTLVALHTPGHSPDHIALWDEDSRTVFTGDLVVQGSSVMIHATRGGDLAQYLAALERLEALRPSRLLPAHGPEILNPDLLLRSHLEHRRIREAQVIEALATGRDAVSSIVESIYDGLAPALVPAASENVRAHLEKLKREGRVLDRDGRWTLSDQS